MQDRAQQIPLHPPGPPVRRAGAPVRDPRGEELQKPGHCHGPRVDDQRRQFEPRGRRRARRAPGVRRRDPPHVCAQALTAPSFIRETASSRRQAPRNGAYSWSQREHWEFETHRSSRVRHVRGAFAVDGNAPLCQCRAVRSLMPAAAAAAANVFPDIRFSRNRRTWASLINPSSTRKTGSLTRLSVGPRTGRSRPRQPAKIIVVDHALPDNRRYLPVTKEGQLGRRMRTETICSFAR